MREITLRPHHLLCVMFFVGKGYDQSFVRNMERIVSELRRPGDLLVRLRADCDDICICCPHRSFDRCEFESSVRRKDRSVASFLGLDENAALLAVTLMRLVQERLEELDGLEGVCEECEWMEVCNERLTSVRREMSWNAEEGPSDH